MPILIISQSLTQAALIGGLGGERTRWQQTAAGLAKTQVRCRIDAKERLCFVPDKAAAVRCLHRPFATACVYIRPHKCTFKPFFFQQECLIGDMLVSAATIAYLGAFTAPWRARLVQAALGLCTAQVCAS